jgi:hypothetical protein
MNESVVSKQSGLKIKNELRQINHIVVVSMGASMGRCIYVYCPHIQNSPARFQSFASSRLSSPSVTFCI